MKLSDLKIDPEFDSMFRKLTDEEFAGLEADIVKNKSVQTRDPLDNPIHVWAKGNLILDGHNRYRILVANRMDTKKIDVHDEFETRSDAIKWILNNQRHRRNLTKEELVKAAMLLESEIAKEAKERQAQYYGNQHDGGLSANLNEVHNIDPIRTAKEAAKIAGMSENTFRDAKMIIENGSREKIDRMNKGGRGNGINTIADEIRNNVPDGYRRCSKCGKIKVLSEFVKRDGDSYTGYCKECDNERRLNLHKKKNNEKREQALLRFDSHESVEKRQFGERIKYTVNMFLDELKANMDSSIGSLDLIISIHLNEFVSEKDLQLINNVFDEHINKINQIKEKYINGK